MDLKLAFVILTLFYERQAYRVQRLTIFSENCCKGKSETYDSSVRNLEEKSVIPKIRSFSIHRGLWALGTGVNYTKDGVYYEGNNDDLNGNCGSSASAGGLDYIQYRSIRFVGNAYLDLPGLSFFTKEGFLGEELYFDGTNLRLPSPYVFKSYGFTGNDSWTIYPLTNFTGGHSCLIAQSKVVSFIHKGTTVTVGSVQRGCLVKRGVNKGKEREGSRRSSAKTLHSHNALILYNEANLSGERLYTDAPQLRLPIPLIFRSYSFVGTKNWTVFSETELTGRSFCLYNQKSSTGKTPTVLVDMSIGSVQRGCESDPVKELITPPPETLSNVVDVPGCGWRNAEVLGLVQFAFMAAAVLKKYLLGC